MAEKTLSSPRSRQWHKWIRRGFIAWGIFVFLYLFSGYRTVDVENHFLSSDKDISVTQAKGVLQLTPASYKKGLVFFCGSGVSSHAYLPLLRPIAQEGYGIFVIKLPYRFAPLESHKSQAVECALRVLTEHQEVTSWVFSGHSLGGALACRVARDYPEAVSGLVLIGTTHPKRDDLSSVSFPVAKVYASHDGIAPVTKIKANKYLLPEDARYFRIEGGNHCQFGHYAGQFLDGKPEISRTDQQSQTRTVILETLASVSE